MIKIREYQEGDREIIVGLENDLKDYLVKIDPLKRLRRAGNYGKIYITNLLKKIKEKEGIIYLAEIDNLPVGMIAGALQDWTEEDAAGSIPAKPGEVFDLIVKEQYRGQKIGSLLLEKIEKYFKEQGCDVIYLNVFAANKLAYNFYKKSNYHDDMVVMEKIL